MNVDCNFPTQSSSHVQGARHHTHACAFVTGGDCVWVGMIVHTHASI